MTVFILAVAAALANISLWRANLQHENASVSDAFRG
jgi:hypothetical protein